MRQIQGDRLEQSRIRLERDLDNNIPSPPSMSSGNIYDADDDVSSVDFARHGSHPHPSFHSFEHTSHLDSDFYSRHGDDDSIALDPDLGHTMSTAAHHASALTLSAGLRGRANCNYTGGVASPSGAEFDPERPLQGMLNSRITDGISLFEATNRSKSKQSKDLKHDQTPTFDPVIVDSTAELDRLLRTGHRRHLPPHSGGSYPYISRSRSQPNPGAPDASDSDTSAPRLSQALGHHFSPKRPRSAPVPTHQLPPRPVNPTSSHTAHIPRLKPIKSQPGPSNLNPTKHSYKHTVVDNRSPDSHFPRVTRGLTRDHEAQSRLRSLDHENENENENDKNTMPRSGRCDIFPSVPASIPGKRPPFSDIVNNEFDDTKRRGLPRSQASSRVHLPDVTGLTSAVQSPIKGGDGYVSPNVVHPSLAVDLLPALDTLQARLQALERENGGSRRRVTELELELEECKAEVAKERTQVKECQKHIELERERERERRIRGKAVSDAEERYRGVIEEKKALEALITTLRTHLARLTSELASHKSLIASLRADICAAGEAQTEVEALRVEVERLAGEVERLKEVVEEGLRERKRARQGNDVSGSSMGERDATMSPVPVGIDLTYATVPLSHGEENQEQQEPLTVDDLEPEQNQQEPTYEPEVVYELEPEPEPEPVSSRTARYIQASELARVESEMRERRSERSLSASKSNTGSNSRLNDSGNGSSLHEVRPAFPNHDQNQDPSPTSSAPRPSVSSPYLRHSSPTTVEPSRRNGTPPKDPGPSTPFPQIRGSRMERLFFSAPEHNARTCTVCHRRKRGGERRRLYEEDEGYREGEAEEEIVKTYLQTKAQRTKRKDRSSADDAYTVDSDRLPPQTVLARVLRELEDDFSHYKAIYLELADQYGMMDAASNVAKRNVLADHLREVIDTLEQRGDQIASLYDLLNFQDKPLPQVTFSRSKHAAFA